MVWIGERKKKMGWVYNYEGIGHTGDFYYLLSRDSRFGEIVDDDH